VPISSFSHFLANLAKIWMKMMTQHHPVAILGSGTLKITTPKLGLMSLTVTTVPAIALLLNMVII
jgi:hypothetical protein